MEKIILLVIICWFSWKILLWTFLFILLIFKGLYKRYPCFLTKLLAVPCYAFDYLISSGTERYVIYHIGFLPCVSLRKLLYQILGGKIAHNSVFHFKTEIRNIFSLVVGKGSIIGDNCILDARNGLIIKDNVNISSNVSIYTLQHDHRSSDFSCVFSKENMVKIENRVWIGPNVIVLPGVTIGEGAVCCAGSIVTKDVEPFSIVAGIPAKKISTRNRNINYEFTGKSCSFY
mgnify:CR=1 FL=1